MEYLTNFELITINGGSEASYNNGYALGSKIRTAVIDACDWVDGFVHGLLNCV